MGENNKLTSDRIVSLIVGVVSLAVLLLVAPMDGRIKSVEEFKETSHTEHEAMRTRTTILEEHYKHILEKLDELIDEKK